MHAAGEPRGVPLETAGPESPPAIRPLTDKEFRLFQALVRREAGIHLSDAKRALLVGRLTRRLRDLGLSSFGAYYQVVMDQHGTELVRMLDRICTNETQFFREPRQFEHLKREIIPAWRVQADSGMRPRHLRVWSAACSTGQEPYSLAMLLLEELPPSSGWEIEILASDLSTRALETARSATWPITRAAEIPNRYLKRYMLKGRRSHEGQMRAAPDIRDLVKFYRLNLSAERYPVVGPFDLIFCRNVLIYFDINLKQQVVERLLALLASDGHLFLGHAESLSGLTSGGRSVGPMVYRRGDSQGRAAAPAIEARARFARTAATRPW